MEGRLGWRWLNGLLIISGAFGLFRTSVLREIGGYARDTVAGHLDVPARIPQHRPGGSARDTVAEDMDVVVRLQRHCRERRQPGQVLCVPDPVCWTEVPTTVATLARQRRRWHRGLMEVLLRHRRLFFRPRMGLLGWMVLPYFFLELI